MSAQREDFTSEIFKIEIKNLAKFGFGVSIRTIQKFEGYVNDNMLEFLVHRNLRSFSRTR